MKLVVQGEKIGPDVLAQLTEITGADTVEEITPCAYRLRDARRNENVASLCDAASLDWAWIPEDARLNDYGLFVTDMDSTLITVECIDEIADMQGLKPQVSAITEAAMRGEIDFDESLRRRVGLLAGLPETALEEVYGSRIVLTSGAERLLNRLKQSGIHTILVSGGFTYFTDRLKSRLGFDEAYGNELEILHGRLTGRILGAIVDSTSKLARLSDAAKRLGLTKNRIIATGDGANDIAMLSAAGLGVAFHAKPVLQAAADYRLNHSGLDGILNFFD